MSAIGTYLKPSNKTRRVEYVKRVCRWCSTQFEILPSVVLRGRGSFCSRACQAHAINARRTKATVVPPPAGHLPIPTLLWPDQKHLRPSRCAVCGGSTATVPTDAGAADAETACRMCGRVACYWTVKPTRPAEVIDLTTVDGQPVCVDCGEPTGGLEGATGRPRLYCEPCKADRHRESERDRRARKEARG